MYRVKDLKTIRRVGYELERVIVVDDTAKKHERNYGNLVRVRPFEGQLDDDELLYLATYLETPLGSTTYASSRSGGGGTQGMREHDVEVHRTEHRLQ